MAASIPALAESLDRVASRLRGMLGEGDAGAAAAAEFVRDLEEEDDIGAGGAGATSAPMPPLPIDAEAVRAELARVEDFVRRARALPRDSKAAEATRASVYLRWSFATSMDTLQSRKGDSCGTPPGDVGACSSERGTLLLALVGCQPSVGDQVWRANQSAKGFNATATALVTWLTGALSSSEESSDNSV